MKTNKYIIYFSLCLAFVLPVQAQKAYTLEECIREALSNNTKMKNSRNDIDMAEHDKKEAFTKYFPQISAAGSGFIANESLVQMEMAPGQKMSMLKDGLMGGVTAALPLFTGGQIVNGNKLADVGVEVKKLEHKMTDNEVALTTENYFWRIVMLKEKIKTVEAVHNQLEKLLQDVQASVDAGLTTRNDLLQVQLRMNEIESSRIQLDNNLDLSLKLLAQYIGHDDEDLDVSFSIGDNLPEKPDSLFCNHNTALYSTSEYALLNQNVKASRLQYKMEIGKNLPTIAIGGGLVYDNLLGYDQTFLAGFATVTVPITAWWGGSHSIKKQKLQIANAENQLQDQSRMLIIRMQQTWDDLVDAYKQIEIAHLSIEQATENLKLNNDFYSAGTCPMSDLLEAQTLFSQSRDKYVEAYTMYEIKKHEYLNVTGR